MTRFLFGALTVAAVAAATPAAALTITGVISGASGTTGSAVLPMPGSPGVYAVSLRFDRPAAELVTEFAVTWTFNLYCDLEGTGDFEYCGGDDVPGRGFDSDDVPGRRHITGLYEIGRPYTRIDGPVSYETGFYYPAGAFFNYIFADAGQVAWQLDVTRVGDVPEPAAWALMVVGFGLAGTMLRRRPAATVRSTGRGR